MSVIIPVYNRPEPLKRALKSVLAQKGVSFEVIVIDDGSTDGTGEMVRAEFAAVQYHYYPENRGPAFARNRGVEKAGGKWIAFLDSDDEWLPGKLKAQMDFFSTHPEYRIAQTEEMWIRNGLRVNPMKKHRKYGGPVFKHCLPLCIISPSAVIMEKSLFEETGGFDESLPVCEDYDLWLRISYQYPVGLIEKPLIKKYGGHKDQLSHKLAAMDQFRIRALIKLLLNGRLSKSQYVDAEKTLRQKARIFITGAKKRGKMEEALLVENILSILEIQEQVDEGRS
ncbi:MAG: glycosyltransferase [Candidatus Omnitrophica bacterium]|nr:glycosyltransferase [Candidatus Omnitrophota bacterium]